MLNFMIALKYHLSLILFIIIISYGDTRKSYPNMGKKSMKDESIAGIYIGRNSISCAVVYGGYFQPILNKGGEIETPLYVSFDKSGQTLIGKQVIHYYQNMNSDEIIDLSLFIGKTYDEIKRMGLLNKNIIDKNNKLYINFIRNSGKLNITLTIEELFSYLFRDIKENVEAFLNSKLTTAAFALNSIYKETEIMSLKAAANKAGIKIIKTMYEYVLSSYFYNYFGSYEEENVLTIDMQNNNTILTLILLDKSVPELIHEEIIHFGADELNNALYKFIIKKYENYFNKKLTDENILKMLYEKVQLIKNDLNLYPFTYFYWNMIGIDEEDGLEISRSKYDELIRHNLDNFFKQFTKFLKNGEISRFDINYIICYGQSIVDLKFIDKIKLYFYGKHISHEKGNQFILNAAALLANLESNKMLEFLFVEDNIVANPINVGIYGMLTDNLVPEGTAIPVTIKKRYTISTDEQKDVLIKFFEGYRPNQRSNLLLGKIYLQNITIGYRGMVFIDIEVKIEQNGILLVTANDVAQNNWKQLKILKDFNRAPPDASLKEQTNDERVKERDKPLHSYGDIRRFLEPLAYEIRSHLLLNTSVVQKLSKGNRFLLKDASTEVIRFFEDRALYGMETEMVELKNKFTTIVFPILKENYS